MGWTLVLSWQNGFWSVKKQCQIGHNFTLLHLVCYKLLNHVFHIQTPSNFVHSNHDLNPIHRADTQNTTVNIKQQSRDQLVQAQISSQSCRANLSKRSKFSEQLCACGFVCLCVWCRVAQSELINVEFIDVKPYKLTNEICSLYKAIVSLHKN